MQQFLQAICLSQAALSRLGEGVERCRFGGLVISVLPESPLDFQAWCIQHKLVCGQVLVCCLPSEVVVYGAIAEATGNPLVLIGCSGQAQGAPCGVYVVHSITSMLQLLARLNHQNDPSLVIVACAMKASREKDLAAAGLLCWVPRDGLCCMPLDLSLPLESQLPFHVLLHKASDELEYSEHDRRPQFSQKIQELQKFVDTHPEVCIVDPLEYTGKVIDRVELCRLTEGLAQLDAGSTCVARAPRYVVVQRFDSEDVLPGIQAAGLHPPLIAKPVAACGLHDSHEMALLLKMEAMSQLPVPCPAVLQEFVNHGGRLYKVYVAADKVFYATRPSIPDILPDATGLHGPSEGYLSFDSLKSLPTSLAIGTCEQHRDKVADSSPLALEQAPNLQHTTHPSHQSPSFTNESADNMKDAPRLSLQLAQPTPDIQVLQRIASYLRQQFQLTLFGFDVVIDSSDGSYVVIDVNYLPHFKEAPGAGMHVRAAIKAAWEQHTARTTL